jgi:hypothetical protein
MNTHIVVDVNKSDWGLDNDTLFTLSPGAEEGNAIRESIKMINIHAVQLKVPTANLFL